jgi:hypothetical protein
LLFALSFSRDGALISFTWFGIGGFLLSTYQPDSYCSNILKAISCLSLVIGFCFRPWLAFSLVVLIFLLRRFGSPTKKLSLSLNLAIVISLLFAPLIIDQLSKKIQSLESSFPEQQVMIMDASSMACLSASRQVSREAIEVLNYLPNSKDVNRKELCGEWFPQNWASTVFYGNSTEGHLNPLSMIPSNDFINYAKFRSSWLNLLGSNIPEYMQIKILLGSQFLLAGDSLNINVDSFKGMLLLPLELLKAFRLFSILPVLCLLLWLALRSRSNETTNRDKVATVNILTAFYLSFSLMSVISFIGDNQRYLFSGSIIVILFYFLLES